MLDNGQPKTNTGAELVNLGEGDEQAVVNEVLGDTYAGICYANSNDLVDVSGRFRGVNVQADRDAALIGVLDGVRLENCQLMNAFHC